MWNTKRHLQEEDIRLGVREGLQQGRRPSLPPVRGYVSDFNASGEQSNGDKCRQRFQRSPQEGLRRRT